VQGVESIVLTPFGLGFAWADGFCVSGALQTSKLIARAWQLVESEKSHAHRIVPWTLRIREHSGSEVSSQSARASGLVAD
jgi:hypothetical protein